MSLELVSLGDQLHHVEALARWHQQEWGHLNPRVDVGTRANRLREAAGKGGIPAVFIAVDGPQLVGSAALVEHDMKDRPDLSPWLAAVFVIPERRRGGIASALVSRAEAEARALGVATLYLFTEDQAGFYRRRGWALLEQRNYHGIDVSVMAKSP